MTSIPPEEMRPSTVGRLCLAREQSRERDTQAACERLQGGVARRGGTSLEAGDRHPVEAGAAGQLFLRQAGLLPQALQAVPEGFPPPRRRPHDPAAVSSMSTPGHSERAKEL